MACHLSRRQEVSPLDTPKLHGMKQQHGLCPRSPGKTVGASVGRSVVLGQHRMVSKQDSVRGEG